MNEHTDPELSEALSSENDRLWARGESTGLKEAYSSQKGMPEMAPSQEAEEVGLGMGDSGGVENSLTDGFNPELLGIPESPMVFPPF